MGSGLNLDMRDLDDLLAVHAPHLLPSPGLTPSPLPSRSAPYAPNENPLTSQAPTLQKPTRKESIAAGKSEFKAGMPTVTDEAGTPGFYKQRIAQNEYKTAHPWGSPISEQPGILGKIGHVLGTVGNVAGDILAPATMSLIPGTQLNRQAQEARDTSNLEKSTQQETLGKEADTRQTEAETAKQRAATEEEKQKWAEEHPAEPKLKSVETDKQGNALGVFEDGSTKPLGYQSAEKPVAEKIPPHITRMVGGQPHIMERDEKTGEYSIDRGIAQPNYGQQILPTKTTKLLGPDNVEHEYQWNQATGKYDIDLGAAPTGTAAHQIFQAGTIEKLVPEIVSDIDANREILGNLSSYYKQWLAGTPVSDPRAAQLMTELMSLAAMQPSLHAFRSQSALEAFEKMVGGLAKNPDSTIASIKGLLKTPQAFTSMNPKAQGTENLNPPEAAKPGMKWQHRTVDGKVEWRQVKE